MFRGCALFLALALAVSSALADQTADSLHTPMGRVGAFTLTDLDGRCVTPEDLRGKFWVAHFFYCTCQTGCAETTANMARLQQAFAGHHDLVLVSVHVNPDDEDIDQLRQFAQGHGADPKQWWFLRGEPTTLEAMLKNSFKVGLARKNDEPIGSRVSHSLRLFLVDPQGEIIGSVADGKDPAEVKRLEQRIRAVLPPDFHEQARAILPGVNASLNGLCTFLLILGYVSIRQRRERLHMACMLSALGVSFVFLASYLFYHFAILEGQPTRFRGEGWIRPVYFGILGSHTVLAVVVAPLALVTVYRGLRDRRDSHRRLARWTFPLWLYVSITGVVVYLMLYHLYPSG